MSGDGEEAGLGHFAGCRLFNAYSKMFYKNGAYRGDGISVDNLPFFF